MQVASSNTACSTVILVHSAAVGQEKQVLRLDVPLLQAFGHWLLSCNLMQKAAVRVVGTLLLAIACGQRFVLDLPASLLA